MYFTSSDPLILIQWQFILLLENHPGRKRIVPPPKFLGALPAGMRCYDHPFQEGETLEGKIP
jgi:hypothetical protein